MQPISKVKYTHNDAENPRYDTVTHMFEPFNSGDWGKAGIISLQHDCTPITANHFSEEVAIGLINDKKAIERAIYLLEASGFERDRLEIKPSGSEAYITIAKAGADDLILATAALAQTYDNPRGTPYYAMLKDETVHAIADLASENMTITPLMSMKIIEMDMNRIQAFGVEDAPSHYTDFDMNRYPVSPVRSIRDDSRYIDRGGKPAFERTSTLSVDPSRIPELNTAFTKAGMEHGVIAEGLLSVRASSHDVVRALTSHALVPQHFARTLDI